MERYLFRVRYDLPDEEAPTYEPVCVRAETEADARAQVLDATKRYADAVKATREVTLVTVTADV